MPHKRSRKISRRVSCLDLGSRKRYTRSCDCERRVSSTLDLKGELYLALRCRPHVDRHHDSGHERERLNCHTCMVLPLSNSRLFRLCHLRGYCKFIRFRAASFFRTFLFEDVGNDGLSFEIRKRERLCVILFIFRQSHSPSPPPHTFVNMAEQLIMRGELHGHSGWVTSLATSMEKYVTHGTRI